MRLKSKSRSRENFLQGGGDDVLEDGGGGHYRDTCKLEIINTSVPPHTRPAGRT